MIGKNCRKCHVEKSADCNFCHNAKNFAVVVKPENIKFETDGGTVTFDHQMHSSKDGLELECKECHHGYSDEKARTYPMSCRRCHYNTKLSEICTQEEIHVRCIGKNCVACHTDDAENCEKCHIDE
jgi:hypothetical protein